MIILIIGLIMQYFRHAECLPQHQASIVPKIRLIIGLIRLIIGLIRLIIGFIRLIIGFIRLIFGFIKLIIGIIGNPINCNP